MPVLLVESSACDSGADAILPYYKQRLADIERIIGEARLLTLPKRAAVIRPPEINLIALVFFGMDGNVLDNRRQIVAVREDRLLYG